MHPEMEYDLILALLMHNPPWLAPFPITCGIEYFVDPTTKHTGRGDLVVCNESYDHFMVVELKQSKHARAKLMAQMLHYRDHLKWKLPMVKVDCAAVQDGKLLTLRRDCTDNLFFTEYFQKAWLSGILPRGLPFNQRHKRKREDAGVLRT